MQSKYLDAPEMKSANTNVGDRDAIQVWGVMATPSVAWGKTLEGLSSIPVTLGNSTAACADATGTPTTGPPETEVGSGRHTSERPTLRQAPACIRLMRVIAEPAAGGIVGSAERGGRPSTR